MSNQYLSFDVTKQSTPQQLITGRQGDSQLKFVSVLLWDGDKNIPYDLTGKQIAFEALKPDGTHIVDYAGVTILDAPHGLFRYSFNEQVFAVAGKIQQAFFKITHTDKDDQVIADSTLEINIHILENRVEFGIDSTNYLSEYDDLIAQVKQKFDDYTATVQDSIDKATALHDQIIEYTDLINQNQVVTLTTFNQELEKIGNPDNVSISIDGGVVEPYTTALQNFKETINDGTDVAKIALIQDLHFQRSVFPEEYSKETTIGLQQIQHVGVLSDKLDVVVNNGDLVHGREPKDATSSRIRQVVNTEKISFGDVPSLFTVGNHDDNNIYFQGASRIKNLLTTSELNKLFEMQKSYSYYDIADKKLRVVQISIFENPEIYDENGLPKYTRDYSAVISDEQLAWLVNEALNAPAGYDVIAFTHCPPLGYMNNTPYQRYQNVNHDLLLGILKAFANHTTYTGTGTNTDYPATVTADFSTNTGKLVALVTGHEHRDAPVQMDNGLNVVLRTCLLSSGRQMGTVQQDAFDIIEVDTKNKRVNFNRFGSGESLAFNY